MAITSGFIYRIKSFFTHINYETQNDASLIDIYDALVLTTIRLLLVTDVNYLFNEYKYCEKKIRRINKMLASPKKKMLFDAFTFDDPDFELTRLENDVNIVLTNVFDKKKKHFRFFETEDNEGNNEHSLLYYRKKYYVYNEYSYYGKLVRNHYQIYDSDDALVMSLKLGNKKVDNLPLVVNRRKSTLVVNYEDELINLYDTELVADQEVASIQWDILTEKAYDHTTAVIWVYDPDYYEIALLLGVGILKMFTKHFYDQDMRQKMMAALIINNQLRSKFH